MRKQKQSKPARVTRVRPISRPHYLLHRATRWELHYLPGGAWPWYQLRYSRTQPNLDGNTRNAYWLAWSVEDSRFADSTDSRHFAQHSPMLFAWLVAWLSEHFLDRKAQAERADNRS